jgi:CHAT domain-containing protein/tetratricopeptide (TPR) repeat protein
LGKRHPDVAVALGNLGLLFTVLGDHAAAEPLLREALRISRAVFGERHPATATTLSRLAGLYRAMGRYADAERQYTKAMAIERKVLPADHPLLAGNLHNLAALRLEMGNPAAAVPLLQRAMEVQQAAGDANNPDRANSLYLLAWARAATLDTGQALELLQQAAVIDDRMIGQVFSIGSEVQRMAYASEIWARCAFHLPLLLEQADRRAAGNTGLDLILRRKALVAESLAMQRTAALGGHYPDLAPQLQELDSLRMRIAARTLGGGGAERYGNARLLEAWIARMERLEVELARQIPEMTLQQQMRAADRRSVAAALPGEAALVEFVRFVPFDFRAVAGRGDRQRRPARYVAFVLAADAPDDVQMLDLGTADQIDGLVAAFRESITGAEGRAGRGAGVTPGERDPTDTRSAIVAAFRDVVASQEPDGPPPSATGEEIRAALIDPLLAALDGRKRLVLAPDGDLTRLPFEVLPLDGASRLIDLYEISYVATGRDVLRFGTGTGGRPGAPVVAADPAFDLGISPDQASPALFRRLAGTRAEGEQVAAMLGVQPILADAVLETRLKAERGPSILHLATHGFFLPDRPQGPNAEPVAPELLAAFGSGFGRLAGRRIANPLLRSGLALAGANTWLSRGDPPPEAEDGLLMAEDVTGLDLLNTELVVLSACDTGLGDIRAGEGVFGLRRAFVQAGAKTLVMSLWKVPDRETQELMVDFYERTLRGEPRAEALRSAQLTLKARNPHPLYWGAFICQGDPGPVSNEIRKRSRSK